MSDETKNFELIVETVYGKKENPDDRNYYREDWFEKMTEEKLYASQPKEERK